MIFLCKSLNYVITSIFIFSPLQPLGMKNIKFSTFYRTNTLSLAKIKVITEVKF